MPVALVARLGLGGFLLEEDVGAGGWEHAGIGLVVAEEAAAGDSGLFGEGLPGIACAGHEAAAAVDGDDVVGHGRWLGLGGCGLGDAAAFVELVEVVGLYDLDEAVAVGREGGVSACLEASGPGFVVGGLEGEEARVAGLLEEEGVVFVAFSDAAVLAELVVRAVVVAEHVGAFPSSAHFDAEMVVGFGGEVAAPGSALEEGLGHGDAGRYVVAAHLVYGHVAVGVDVFLIDAVALLGAEGGGREDGCCHEEEEGWGACHDGGGGGCVWGMVWCMVELAGCLCVGVFLTCAWKL